MAIALYKKLLTETSPQFMEIFEKNLDTIHELFKADASNFSHSFIDYKNACREPLPISHYLETFRDNPPAIKILESGAKIKHDLEINILGSYDYNLNITFSDNFNLTFYSEWDGMGSTDDGVILDSQANITVLDTDLLEYLTKIKLELSLECSEYEIYKTLWIICVYNTPIKKDIPSGFEEWRVKYL